MYCHSAARKEDIITSIQGQGQHLNIKVFVHKLIG